MTLTVQRYRRPAVTITRPAMKHRGLVYVVVANKKYSYEQGKSKIVYIGTTKGGARRIAISAADKAGKLLGHHGVTHLECFVLTTSVETGVPTWQILERGLLIAFRERFGEPPRCNMTGKGMRWRDELKYFSRKRLDSIIEQFSA